jgi:hypothetical protein
MRSRFGISPLNGSTLAVSLALAISALADVPVEIADTEADFAAAQGVNGFTYGYYDRGDGGAFALLPLFNGTHFRFATQPPNTAIGELDPNHGQPNGANSSPGDEHWAVRRYAVEQAGQGLVRWYLDHYPSF